MTRHSIKLQQGTYDRLEEIRDKRETFDDTVARLIAIYTTLERMQDKIIRQGHQALREEVAAT